jgi:hypothetical protein
MHHLCPRARLPAQLAALPTKSLADASFVNAGNRLSSVPVVRQIVESNALLVGMITF